VSSSAKPATVRFYVDADVLGLAKILVQLRPDVTYPGDPGGVLHRRARPACPVASPAVLDTDWIPVVTRQAIALLPSLLSRPMALAQTRSIAERYWGGTVRRSGAHLLLEVRDSVTVESAPGSLGCTYYEESLHEMLRLLGAASGRVDHVRCAARKEGHCEWRVDWRNIAVAA